MLEEGDRVVVADRLAQQRLRVRRGRPGTPCSQGIGDCECIAPKLPPAPIAERTTSGHGPCSFDTYQYFAAWFTKLSIESSRKSANMISKIGRSPLTAAPNAPADIASSEIGVSMTRSPKRS